MKIVYCVPQLYNSAGMERILVEKINWLASKGHEIIVLLTDGKGKGSFFPLQPSVKVIDLNLNYLDDFALNPIQQRFVAFKKRKKHRRLLENLLNEIKPDVTVSTFFDEALFLHKMNVGGLKVLEYHFIRNLHKISPRNGLIRQWIDALRDIQKGKIVRKYDRFIVLTEQDKKDWGSGKNIHVIPNFVPSASSELTTQKYKKIIACGRLSPEKGFDRLIDAWARIAHEFPEWTLEIYGDGSLFSSLEKRIKDLNLQSNTKLCHSVNNIDEKMAEASICAVSSHYEGFSLVIVEAFMGGLPVVAFDIPHGPRSLVRNGENGFLVADGNISAFADALKKLITDNSLRNRLGHNARIDSLSYSKEEIMSQWLTIFKP